MKIIDLNTWERTTHYNFFRRMDYPHHNMCINIDISNFLAKIRKKHIPFYYAMIYAATQCMNQVEQFRYRIRDEQVVLHEVIHPAFSEIAEGSDLFKMVTVELEGPIELFAQRAREKSNNQKDYFVFEDIEGRDDLIFITCVPWLSFTQLSHTISFNKDDSFPRLAWGKHFMNNGKTLMPFSVQAHHSFVDGVHVARYVECLQEYLDQI